MIRILLGALLLLATCTSKPKQEKVIVFAAASTANAMTEVAQLFEQEIGIKVKLNFAASSTLARQIEAGAEADIYISANPKWMNYLKERNLIIPETRFNLLSNRLVLAVPPGTNIPWIEDSSQIATWPGRIAIGDPAHVPAGIYAKQALESLGWWGPLKDKIVPTQDVRAALRQTQTGQTEASIIYQSDLKSTNLKNQYTFPITTHQPIAYPVAQIDAKDAASSFRAFMRLEHTQVLFETSGFRVEAGFR